MFGASGYVNDTVRDGKAVFDEPGYIANPPCMWGRPEDGLAPPPKMNGVTIFVKAVTNSTVSFKFIPHLPSGLMFLPVCYASAL
jgi:hypothetical protein